MDFGSLAEKLKEKGFTLVINQINDHKLIMEIPVKMPDGILNFYELNRETHFLYFSAKTLKNVTRENHSCIEAFLTITEWLKGI